MPKIDIDRLRRPDRQATTKEFKDPLQPDNTIQLTLRPLDPLEEDAAEEKASHMIKVYIRGGWIDPRTGDMMKEPLPMHAIDGGTVTLSEKAIRFACRLEACQADTPANESYSAEELLRMAPCFPNAWFEIQKFYYLVDRENWGKA